MAVTVKGIFIGCSVPHHLSDLWQRVLFSFPWVPWGLAVVRDVLQSLPTACWSCPPSSLPGTTYGDISILGSEPLFHFFWPTLIYAICHRWGMKLLHNTLYCPQDFQFSVDLPIPFALSGGCLECLQRERQMQGLILEQSSSQLGWKIIVKTWNTAVNHLLASKWHGFDLSSIT